MKQWLRAQGGWWLAWLALTGVGAAWLARAELAQLQQDFGSDVRIAHRIMSQQVVQYDAVLATVALLEPGAGADHPASVGAPPVRAISDSSSTSAAAACNSPGEIAKPSSFTACDADCTLSPTTAAGAFIA